MKLKEIIYSLNYNQAILHYNVSTFEQIKAGILSVLETKIPLIFGVSEGERDYLGAGLVRQIINFYEADLPIFLNADHSKTIDSAKEAIDLDYSAVLFDGSNLNLEENIKITKELIIYRHQKNILIEGEVGKIEGKSDVQDFINIDQSKFTNVDEAVKFVNQTGVDLLAISIGNFHGVVNFEPKLDLSRAKEIYEAVKIPLVLHGGSGIGIDQLKEAIKVGFKIIHLNTEFRVIWKEKLKQELDQQTVTPYKILDSVVNEIKNKIIFYQKLFWLA